MPARTRLADIDPLTLALAPPKDESPADRWAREQREAAARAVSDRIDAQIKAEKQDRKRKGEPIKVLLLGQSESGKSTTVKNFQLAYAYSSFLEERTAWRAVIHLNLVRSVNTILDVLAAELARAAPPPSRARSPVPVPFASSSHIRLSPSGEPDPDLEDIDADPDLDDPDADEADDTAARPSTPFPPPALPASLRLLHLRLAPLRQVQADLERTLGASSSESLSCPIISSPTSSPSSSAAPWTKREFGVISRSGWKSALRRVKGREGAARGKGAQARASIGSRDEARVETASVREGRRGVFRFARASLSSPSPAPPAHSSSSDTGPDTGPDSDIDDGDEDTGDLEQARDAGPRVRSAAEVIASCAEDMAALWADAAVRGLLAKRRMRVEEGSGFFLDDVARVAARGYEPSDEDVVRARLRTMGVQEYRFIFERGAEAGREWRIYDVGGARSSRHAWYPYFEDINAIIFLAPISCFDERLAEDRRVNRLQDSLLLWRAVCASELLKGVQMILFLNKCDLLQMKLSRGVKVVDFVPSYGDRPNEPRHVARYFRQQFKDIFVKDSPEPRGFYSFLTSVVDTKATAATVATVREGIQRNHLRQADVI